MGSGAAPPRQSGFLSTSIGWTGWESPTGTITGATRPGQGAPSVADPRPVSFVPQADNPGLHHGKYVVVAWNDPARTITGATRMGLGAFSVCDPRAAWFRGTFGVLDWAAPAGTITSNARPSTGRFSISDPRLGGSLGVVPWHLPIGAVTGEGYPTNGAFTVSDPRFSGWPGALGVQAWDSPSVTITGRAGPTTGRFSVADHRMTPHPIEVPRAYPHCYGVLAWTAPSFTVAGQNLPGCGFYSVADHRILWSLADGEPTPLGSDAGPSPGTNGILPWSEAAKVIAGAACLDNGPFAVADPRFPDAPPAAIIDDWTKPPYRLVEKVVKGKTKIVKEAVPLIIEAEDGTCHRPMTTWELLALQGFPVYVRGKATELPGSSSRQREMIGNAVPPPAARAVAEQMLLALIAADTGCFYMSSTGVWCLPEEKRQRLAAEGAVPVSARKPWRIGNATILDDGAVVRAQRKKERGTHERARDNRGTKAGTHRREDTALSRIGSRR